MLTVSYLYEHSVPSSASSMSQSSNRLQLVADYRMCKVSGVELIVRLHSVEPLPSTFIFKMINGYIIGFMVVLTRQ